ncbi:hypothetical protein PVPAM_040005400 [Plasmodium vivax]|nr:hypothetical protein PVPAM_040005400 [Plasmodium vivax]
MSRIATDNHLLTYEYYYKFKDKFKQTEFENDDLNPDYLLDDEKFNKSNRHLFRPVLKELLRHIRNHGVFYYHEPEACSYISYILSKDAQKIEHEYKEKTFDMFQEFVNTYNAIPKYKSTNCSTSLVYVNPEMYKKMNKLYLLYEEYKKHLKDNKPGEEESCPYVSLFLSQYNEFISKNQPTHRRYKYILENFEKQIKDSVYLYKLYACKQKQFHVENIVFTDLSENKKPKPSVPIEQQQHHAQSEESLEKSPPLHAVSHRAHEPHQTAHQSHQAAHQSHQAAHVYPQTHQGGNHSFQETLALSEQPVEQKEVRGVLRREMPETELKKDLSPEYPPPYGSLESSGESSYSEPNPYLPVLPSSNEVGDTSSSVMSTITSALRDVEPGPVLGVSGGMGVLFLLFKYTPVGSFFGGRRGRFRQIPSSFRGFPPGEFPNFQEYEGGYIGYGPMNINPLAE